MLKSWAKFQQYPCMSIVCVWLFTTYMRWPLSTTSVVCDWMAWLYGLVVICQENRIERGEHRLTLVYKQYYCQGDWGSWTNDGAGIGPAIPRLNLVKHNITAPHISISRCLVRRGRGGWVKDEITCLHVSSKRCALIRILSPQQNRCQASTKTETIWPMSRQYG